MINNSSADSSISLKFLTEFDHITPNLQQPFKTEGPEVKVTAWKGRLIAELLLS